MDQIECRIQERFWAWEEKEKGLSLVTISTPVLSCKDEWTDEWMGKKEWINKCIEKWIDKQTSGWMNEKTSRQTN